MRRGSSGGGSSHFSDVGQVSVLPVRGGSASARGRRPLQPADREVRPTSATQYELLPSSSSLITVKGKAGSELTVHPEVVGIFSLSSIGWRRGPR